MAPPPAVKWEETQLPLPFIMRVSKHFAEMSRWGSKNSISQTNYGQMCCFCPPTLGCTLGLLFCTSTGKVNTLLGWRCLLHCQTGTGLKEQSKLFFFPPNLPCSLLKQGYGSWRIYEVSILGSKLPAANVPRSQQSCELPLPFPTLECLTFYPNYTFFALELHKSLRSM